MNTPPTSRIVSSRLPLAACLLMATAVCSAIDLPTQFPINMGFKSLTASADDSESGNEPFDANVANLQKFPVHHLMESKINTVRAGAPNALIISANPGWSTVYKSSDNPDTITMFPGLFLYYVGTKSRQNVGENNPVIPVWDASVFENRDKKPDGSPDMDHVIIYKRNDDGTPNWTNFEYAELTGYDVTSTPNTITVKRGTTGSTRKAWSSGTYIAPHVAVWEVNTGSENKSNFQFNFSMHAPIDPKHNKRPNEWIAEVVAADLINNQSDADGVEHDEVFNTYIGHSRAIDADNDGKADYGYFGGVNSVGLGWQKYAQTLRNYLDLYGDPEKEYYIQFDSDNSRTGFRGWKHVNGAQMETFMDGFVEGTTPGTYVDANSPRFSEAYEHHAHWVDKVNALGRKPFTYGYCKMPTTKYHEEGENKIAGNNAFRRHYAVGLMLGMPHPYGCQSAVGMYQWDEQNGGTLNNYHWLGTASGNATREPAAGTTKIDTNVPWQILIEPGYTAKLSSACATSSTLTTGTQFYPSDTTEIEVTGVAPNVNAPNEAGVRIAPVTRPTLTIGTDYTLTFEAKASTSYTINEETFTDVPRQIKIYGFGGFIGYVLADSDWRTYTLSFTAKNTSGNENTSGNVQLGFSETIGKVWFKNIKLQQGNTNRISREFANGKVFLNMTKEPWTIPLPTGNYHYLKGDTSFTNGNPMNNGNSITTTANTVIVNAFDAVFLHKGPVPAATPIPTPAAP